MAVVQRTRGRAAFDGYPMQGLTYIVGGTLASTTSYLDLALPAQYTFFRLILAKFAASDPTNDNLCFAWSSNGGTTFAGGTGHTGAYAMAHANTSYVATVNASALEAFQDSLGYAAAWVVGDGDATGQYYLEADIYPGDATTFPVWSANAKIVLPVAAGTVNNVAFVSAQVTLDRSSSGTVPAARMNLLRLLPYAAGDTTPSANHGLAAGGTYALYGFRV